MQKFREGTIISSWCGAIYKIVGAFDTPHGIMYEFKDGVGHIHQFNEEFITECLVEESFEVLETPTNIPYIKGQVVTLQPREPSTAEREVVKQVDDFIAKIMEVK